MMSALVHRNCPNCGLDQPIVLFALRFDQFVHVNPTHNLAWFESLGFANDQQFSFVRCANCEFVYSESRLNDELNDQFYHTGIDSQKSLQKIYSIDKKLDQSLIWCNLLHAFACQAESDDELFTRKLKVLDFGAGWGDFLAAVKSPGIEVFGLEFDRNKIKFACSNGISVGEMDFIENNAPYDIFCCNQVLEHLDKPKESLQQLKGFLNQNAVGFISVPDFSLHRMDRLIRDIKQGKAVIKEINPWGHLNYFTPTSLRQMLFDLQFTEIQTPLPARFNSLLPKKYDCNLSLFKQFWAHQSKAFHALLGVLRKAGKPSKQPYTSVFVKINKR